MVIVAWLLLGANIFASGHYLLPLCDSPLSCRRTKWSGLTGNEMCYRFRSTSSVKSLVKDHRSAYEEWISETISSCIGESHWIAVAVTVRGSNIDYPARPQVRPASEIRVNGTHFVCF